MNQWTWAYIKPYIIQQLMQKGTQAYDDAVNSEDQRADQPLMPPNAKE
jgi:hypothetical protein